MFKEKLHNLLHNRTIMQHNFLSIPCNFLIVFHEILGGLPRARYE